MNKTSDDIKVMMQSRDGMNETEPLFFRILNIFAHFVLLNLLWLLCALPVITLIPATSALFSVVRQWLISGIDAGSTQLFFHYFKANFKRSFSIGLLWLLAGLILFIDFYLVSQVQFTGDFFVLILIIFASIIYLFVTLYSLCIMAHYELTVMETLKNALFLSVSHLLRSVLSLLIIGLALVLVFYLPFMIFIVGSVLAFILYNIFHTIPVVKNRTESEASITR